MVLAIILVVRIYFVYRHVSLSCGRVGSNARDANTISNAIAQHDTLLIRVRRARQIDVLQPDVFADRSRAANQAGNILAFLAAADAMDVFEQDVRDIDPGGLSRADLWVDVEVAGVEDDGPVDVLDVHAVVGDVVDVAVSDVGAGPGLETSAVLGVQHGHVGNVSVLDVVQDAWVLANRAHADTMGAIAPQVLDVDVRGVGLGGETVITDVDSAVGDADALDVQRVPTIGVLGKSGDVVGNCLDEDVVVADVVRADVEVGPAGRVHHLDPADIHLCCIVREEEDGSVVSVVSVQNLAASKAVVPVATMLTD